MEFSNIITAIAIGSAALFYVDHKATTKYEDEITQATVDYLAPLPVERVAVHNDDMAVATYHRGRYICQAHLVDVMTNPRLGIMGEVCQ